VETRLELEDEKRVWTEIAERGLDVLSRPTRMEATAVSAVMPITTPKTVRKERSLCSRSVSSPILAFSPKWNIAASF